MPTEVAIKKKRNGRHDLCNKFNIKTNPEFGEASVQKLDIPENYKRSKTCRKVPKTNDEKILIKSDENLSPKASVNKKFCLCCKEAIVPKEHYVTSSVTSIKPERQVAPKQKRFAPIKQSVKSNKQPVIQKQQSVITKKQPVIKKKIVSPNTSTLNCRQEPKNELVKVITRELPLYDDNCHLLGYLAEGTIIKGPYCMKSREPFIEDLNKGQNKKERGDMLCPEECKKAFKVCQMDVPFPRWVSLNQYQGATKTKSR